MEHNMFKIFDKIFEEKLFISMGYVVGWVAWRVTRFGDNFSWESDIGTKLYIYIWFGLYLGTLQPRSKPQLTTVEKRFPYRNSYT